MKFELDSGRVLPRAAMVYIQAVRSQCSEFIQAGDREAAFTLYRNSQVPALVSYRQPWSQVKKKILAGGEA